jgi:hypothetical protein
VLRDEQLRLEIFGGYPFLERFRRLADPRAPFAIGLLSVAVFLVAALVDQNCVQGHLSQIVCQDVRTYLDATNKCHHYRLSTEMSASRDLPSLILLFALPMTIPLAIRQWDNITRFLSAMHGRKILVVKDEQQVLGEVTSCNRYFAKWATWNPLIAFAALLTVLLVVRAQTAGSVYPSLQTSRFGHGIDPSHWWLTMDGVSLAGMLYFLLGCVVVYIIFIQTVHGSRVVLLLWRTRHALGCGMEIANSDKYYGWSEVRAILLATWSLIIIHAICLAMVGLSLPRGQAIAIILAPLLFQWLLVSPIYLLVPYEITRRNVSEWKRKERARLVGEISEEASDAKRRSLEQEMVDLRKMKVNPYSGIVQRLLYYIGTIASILFVLGTIRLLYG